MQYKNATYIIQCDSTAVDCRDKNFHWSTAAFCFLLVSVAVFKDEQRQAVNLGDVLHVNSAKVEIKQIMSRMYYIYQEHYAISAHLYLRYLTGVRYF